jgi:hypothetical protein
MSNAPSEREDAPESAVGLGAAIQEKVNEYSLLVGPVEQAIRDMQLTRGMLRARAEEEINALSPPLAALTEALEISTLDLLMAQDRAAFLQSAVARAGLPIEEVRRLLSLGGGEAAGGDAREDLRALNLPEGA